MLKMVMTVILIILFITFMQGIYKYVPETNYASRVYSVAAVLYLKFVLHVMLFCMLIIPLYFYIITFNYYYYYYYYHYHNSNSLLK
jgi:hypothetical protein